MMGSQLLQLLGVVLAVTDKDHDSLKLEENK